VLTCAYETTKIERDQHLAAAERHRSIRAARSRRSNRRRTVLRYAAAALLLPTLVAGWSTVTGLRPGTSEPPPVAALPEPPAHDQAKLTAVVVAGATGAESLDVLAPYEVLAASGRFNVYTLAPEREPLRLFPGSPELAGVDFLPHYSFDAYARQVGMPPDLVVLPYIPAARDEANAPVLAWLGEHVTSDTTLLTICGGSWVAADAGLLDDRTATTHRNLFATLDEQHPDVHWVQGERWIEDGNVISSAGITAAVDATLRTIERLVGRAVAEDTAAEIGYPHPHLLDDPSYTVPIAGTSSRTINALYRPNRTKLGVALYDGVGELDVASIVDLYPRTLASTIHPIGITPGVITTRHGLHLAPRDHLTRTPDVDRLLIPGTLPAEARRKLDDPATDRLPRLEAIHADTNTFAFDAALADIARHDSRAAARLVATGIEYPADLASHTGRPWPTELLIRPLALSLLGLLTAAAIRRSNRRREVAA
jgi:transcriptional regulator GlxA family with amidase domain